MRNQTLKTVLFSSLAILLLALAWGFRQIPAQSDLAQSTLKSGLEQELLSLSTSVHASTEALQFKLLDVLKAEGGDHSSRAFQESPFTAASLLEWDQTQWKSNWFSVKAKDEFPQARLQELMKDWPLSKLSGGEAYFVKIGDIQGSPHFALLTAVRRPNQIPLVGVGVFPAAQFGLVFSASSNREIRVFDDRGFALALSRPSYLGASVKNENLPQEILENGEVSYRGEWKNDRGEKFFGTATRLADSNLFASVETKIDFGARWIVKAWLYLLLMTLGAIALNWWVFSTLLKPVFEELRLSEIRREQLSREPGVASSVLADGKLATLDFIEPPTATPEAEAHLSGGATDHANETANGSRTETATETETDSPTVISLQSVVKAALKSFDSRIKAGKIEVRVFGIESLDLEADPLQLQTALEEILKNAIESMESLEEGKPRILTLRGAKLSDRHRLLIEDTGHGISEENLAKVFDPFFSTRDSEGVARGLGLNVARRVIEELSGSVRLSNRLEAGQTGARVDIEWPFDAAKAAAKAAEAEKELILEEEEPMAVMPKGPRREAPIGVREALEQLASEIDNDWPEITIRKPKVRMLD